jgi:hypothetical protein
MSVYSLGRFRVRLGWQIAAFTLVGLAAVTSRATASSC